jgi:hypothetical protein
MPAEEIGSLAQKVLSAYNKLAELKASGAGPLAIRIAENVLEKAKLAQQAATGSQQGLGLLSRGGGGALANAAIPINIWEPGFGLGGPQSGTEANPFGPGGTPLSFGLEQLANLFLQGGSRGGAVNLSPAAQLTPQPPLGVGGGGQGMTRVPSGPMLPEGPFGRLFAGQQGGPPGGRGASPVRFLPNQVRKPGPVKPKPVPAKPVSPKPRSRPAPRRR